MKLELHYEDELTAQVFPRTNFSKNLSRLINFFDLKKIGFLIIPLQPTQFNVFVYHIKL